MPHLFSQVADTQLNKAIKADVAEMHRRGYYGDGKLRLLHS